MTDAVVEGIGNARALDRLAAWLDKHLERPVAGALSADLIAGGRSNPTYRLSDGQRSWVLRRPPMGHVLETAHDMTREFAALTALQDTTVPVPAVVGLCRDESVIGASFYVMDLIDGITLRTADDTAQLTVKERSGLSESFVQVVANLHAVDPQAVGFGELHRANGYLERQVRRWTTQWRASATRDLPQVDELLARLGESIPEQGPSGIVHGDVKIDNLMVSREDPAHVLGLLDWEMSTIGDTLSDLGLLCSFWDQPGEAPHPITAGATAFEGFLTRDQIVERYVSQRAVDVEHLDWYVVFADVKIAVILEGIHARHLSGHTVGEGFSDIGAMVGPLAARAAERAAASHVRGLRQ